MIATRPRGSVEIQYFVDVASFIDIKWTRKKNASWKGELSSDSYGYTEDEWYEYMYHYQWIDENKSYSNLEYSIKKITIPFVGKRVRKDDLNDDELGWPEAILALVHRDRVGGPCPVRLDSETAKEMMNEWENVSERVRFFPSQELHNNLTC